jgi:hypothetical protein
MSTPWWSPNTLLRVVLIGLWIGGWVPLVSAGTREAKSKAPVPQTGQTQCWDAAGALIPCAGTGQDGEFQAGVAWPTPRFTDRGDGTVRDNLTGLIWLKQANCFPGSGGFGLTWEEALQAANTLASGSCDLADGSQAGAWRLPNIRELNSLIDFGFVNPALSNAAGTGHWAENDAFSGVQSRPYWSSTTSVANLHHAWLVLFDAGDVRGGFTAVGDKVTSPGLVWPVRGGN